MKTPLYILTFLFLLTILEAKSQEGFKRFNRSKEPETVKELTASLIAGVSDDSLKIEAIYKWITGNISYDYSVYMSGEPIRYQSPELVFRRHKTTCTGYSNLMVEMLEIAGIHAYTVEGFTHDFVLGIDSTKLSSDHAWVAFAMDGNWYVADPTWDSGNIGVMKTSQTEIIKKSFWKRLKTFKLKNLFKKKKRKSTNKTTTRTKVSYKVGFTRMPTREFLFADPNEFLKTHLPNVASIQMKTAPISVEHFCDSSHSLGNHYFTETGSFNYNLQNEAYYNLEIPDRMLWISDSSLNYHQMNHGDKALSAHNYLAYFYGEKTNSTHVLEKFSSISDTVIVHGTMAIKINKAEYKKKRTAFSQAFQAEKKFNFAQAKQVSTIRTHVANNTEIYRKCRERINQKELITINKWQDRITEKFGAPQSLLPPVGWDTIPQATKTLQVIHAMRDSILKYQEVEKNSGSSYISNLTETFSTTRMAMYTNAMQLYEAQFLNEQQVLVKDQHVLDSLTQLNLIMRDSVNAYLSNRKSYALIMQFNQIINVQASEWAAMQKKDSLFPAWDYFAYSNFILADLLKSEREIIETRLENSVLIESAIKTNIRNDSKELGLDMKELTYLKTQRQAYLTKMMNNKFNRSIKVYTVVINNAKNWKRMYKAKLKSLEQAV